MAPSSDRELPVTTMVAPAPAMDATARDPGGPTPAPHVAAAAFADSTASDRYLPGQTIGEGGMGVITLCADRRIGRRVAMKTLRVEESQRVVAEARFLREARIQGQLEHPAVVPVYDLGRTADERAYFTMKRVRGATLADILASLAAGEDGAAERHPTRRLLGAFASICLAVEFAHERGVIHRDLKPANVMLGDFGEVYVLDWGVARVLADDGVVVDEGATRITPIPGDGAEIVGTPAYMAPEQLRGEPATARSDVYALGVMLYEILTLHPLHTESTLGRQLVAILGGLDARASARAPARAVPPELDAICVRAVKPTPAQRYGSARELHDALQAYLDGERDLQLRTDLARRHADAAKASMSTLRSISLADRRRLLREVGRALALDPDNADALTMLPRILAEPPAEVPDEVAQRLLDEEIAGRRRLRWPGVLSFGSILFNIPLYLWAGVRSWAWFAAVSVPFILAALICLGIGRRRHVFDPYAEAVLLLVTLAFTACSSLFGPLVFSPALIALTTFGFASAMRRHRRWWPITLGVLALLAPLAAQQLGLTSAFYGFEDGRMVILPQMMELRRVPAVVFLTVSNLLLVVIAGLAGGVMRDGRVEAQRRAALQTWQLSQLAAREPA